MKNKLPELHALLYTKLPKLLLVTETWLSESKGMSDNLLDPDHCFNIYRCDRQTLGVKNIIKNGGGVCAFVSRTIKSAQVLLSDQCSKLCADACIETVSFDLYLGNIVYRIILIYRPPSSCSSKISSPQVRTNYLISTLDHLIHPRHTTFIFGDFNFPHIDWLNNQTIYDNMHNIFFRFHV